MHVHGNISLGGEELGRSIILCRVFFEKKWHISSCFSFNYKIQIPLYVNCIEIVLGPDKSMCLDTIFLSDSIVFVLLS